MIAVSRQVLIENGQFKMSKRSWSQDVRAKHGRGKYAGFLDYCELNATQISIAIKHLTVFRHMLDIGQAFALVLEDDAIFNKQFAVDATDVLARVPQGWDFIGIGEGCGLRVPERHPDETIYRMRPPRTNCAGAYFISARLAAALIARGKPFTWPIDWLMQYIMTTEDHACYWRDPPLVGHGSETGLFPSMTHQARVAAMDENAASQSDQHTLARRLANTVAKARRFVQRH
jgi:GR25 family glycosyltransferase involved in LPS biosynthesis